MINITQKSQCTGCHACATACPKNCIQMVSDEEGFWYPQVDKAHCINCGLCEKVCPVITARRSDNSFSTTAIAAINLNTETRLNSSSGGIFTLISEAIIEQGGVVFGATFSEDFKSVHHICIDHKSDIEKLRGSKYVQSKIGDSYAQVKNHLEQGRRVLFTGTPCQIAGLYAFIRCNYENLYTQDIICHGVPSPKVWKKYVEERESKANSKTKRLFFRHKKKYGWKSYAVCFEFENNTKYIKNFRDDAYMKAFLANICLRPSCYDCSFKTLERQADLTLADFWGCQEILPKMDDDKGTSLVLIHSEKGLQLWDAIESYLKSEKVDISVVSKYNPSGIKSSKMNDNRSLFLSEYEEHGVMKTVKKYIKEPMRKVVRRNLKMLLKKREK